MEEVVDVEEVDGGRGGGVGGFGPKRWTSYAIKATQTRRMTSVRLQVVQVAGKTRSDGFGSQTRRGNQRGGEMCTDARCWMDGTGEDGGRTSRSSIPWGRVVRDQRERDTWFRRGLYVPSRHQSAVSMGRRGCGIK